MPMVHPDKAYGHRITIGGKSICYLTDTEVSRTPDRWQAMYAEFVEGADIVIVDAMYGLIDYHEHYDFGHSAAFTWIDFFAGSNIGELVFFHHDPQADDIQLNRLLNSALDYQQMVASEAPWKLSLAYQGQKWVLE